ncbi:MAG: helix-turn-helix domain-containing protein [Propionibacteriales bacterium]|nr:helix-turn-helix domain-containing protein [Propionibacteriales bacterium]
MVDSVAGTSASTVGAVRSVGRAFDLVTLFDARHPSHSLRDLVAATGLPKTTVVRLVSTLEQRRLLTTRTDGTYTLGAGFLRWVRLAQSIWEVDEETRRLMRKLVDECGETVNVYVRQDTNRLSIAQEEGTATVRSVVQVGVPMPLSVGASSKVLLGGAGAEVVDQLATVVDHLDVDSLRRQVAAVTETGYAVTHGERELGASSVAAPIRARDGRVVAALSVSGPTSRFTADQIASYVKAVTKQARAISESGLGGVEALL